MSEGIRPPSDYSWKQFEPTHGAQTPSILAPIAEELRRQAEQAAPWIALPVFAPTTEAWAWAEASCLRYRAYLDKVGLIDNSGQPIPATQQLWHRAEVRAQQLREQLGLTPVALAKIVAKRDELAAAVRSDTIEAWLEDQGRALLDEVAPRKRSLEGPQEP